MINTPDEDAFVALYASHSQKLCRMFLGLLREEEYDRISIAEELVQTTFQKAWTYRSTYRGDAKLVGWLYAIARNVLLDYRRKQCCRILERRVELAEFFEHEDGILQDGSQSITIEPVQERQFLQIEIRTHIIASVVGLSEFYRTVLFMRDIEGFSIKEIAEKFSCTERLVKEASWRARNHVMAQWKRFETFL